VAEHCEVWLARILLGVAVTSTEVTVVVVPPPIEPPVPPQPAKARVNRVKATPRQNSLDARVRTNAATALLRMAFLLCLVGATPVRCPPLIGLGSLR
jgi:hypothetical protein